MASRPSRTAPILAVLAIALLLLSGYSGGYVLLGEVRSWSEELKEGDVEERLTRITRVFPQPWHVALYLPATTVEAAIRRIDVQATDELSWTLKQAAQ